MRLYKKLPADTLTAIVVFKRIQGENKCLLEGAAKDADSGRYSLLASDPVHDIQVYQDRFFFDGKEQRTQDPLREIDRLTLKEEKESELPFEAGAIGYVGYDTVALYESIGTIPEDDLQIPDCHFFLYESFVIFDHQEEQLFIVEDNCYSGRSEEALREAMAFREKQLTTPLVDENTITAIKKMTYTSNVTKETYQQMVEHAKQHIEAGDFFQVVLSQRLEATFTGDAFDYYRKLRLLNPSPYLFYLDFGETKLIGSSPESLISKHGRKITTNPIAGTRKRGQTKAEDRELEESLLSDEKELSEHRMLVDLGRNDIGKVARIGTVKVPVYLTIERYRFLMHLVSVVEGELKEGLTALDALRSTLPAGTVSGAPKIRAMQRIYEWENRKRGPYAGAIGYLTKHGDADFALAIRTMVLHKQKAYVQAGAGIVYDSDPESEYLETLQKAKALLEVGE